MKNIMLLLLVFVSLTVTAQDKIVKKTGDVIECKVTEMAAGEVKYHYADNPKLIFGIDNAKVSRVEFGTGEVIDVKSNTFNDEDYYAGQNKRALKINFLSPLVGSTEIAYEQSVKPGQSWETSLGFVGLGIDNLGISPVGVYGKFAYKFVRSPDFYSHKMHYSHILKGAYFAPELALRYVAYDYNDYIYSYYSSSSTTERKEDFAVALMLKLGKQWVFGDAFLLDVYAGIGYGFSGSNETLPYGFIAGNSDVPIAFTSGLRIGWTF